MALLNESIKKMWEAYLKSIDESVKETQKIYDAWHFCNDEKNANALADLVKKRIKQATTSLFYLYELEEEPLPEKGQYSIILDWNGTSQCIIRSTSIEVLPFNEVTETFAKEEGEGDQSLEYWKKVHKVAFENELMSVEKDFSEDMLVVCEKFQVVYPK